MRATLRLSSPAWLAQPSTTSSSAARLERSVALQQCGDGKRGQVIGAHGRQRASVAPDGRTDGVADESLGHGANLET